MALIAVGIWSLMRGRTEQKVEITADAPHVTALPAAPAPQSHDAVAPREVAPGDVASRDARSTMPPPVLSVSSAPVSVSSALVLDATKKAAPAKKEVAPSRLLKPGPCTGKTSPGSARPGLAPVPKHAYSDSAPDLKR